MNTRTDALPNIEELRGFLGTACARDDLPLANFLRSYWLEENHVSRLPFLLQEVAPLLEPTDRVLDVGSFGEWLLLLWRYLGISDVHACSLEGGYLGYGDGSLRDMTEAAKSFEITIAEVDIENEPLPHVDESLDVVTCFEVIEHLRVDPVFVLSEFNRVLRPGGLLVLSTPNVDSFEGIVRMVRGQSPHIFSRYMPDRGGLVHCKEYAVDEVYELMTKCGFDVERYTTFDYLSPIGLSPELLAEYDGLRDYLTRTGWDAQMGGQTLLAFARKSSPPHYRYYEPLYTTTEIALQENA